MKGRPFHDWPALLLDVVVRTGRPRDCVADAWIELHARAAEEADAACGELESTSGPYRVSPPEGMH